VVVDKAGHAGRTPETVDSESTGNRRDNKHQQNARRSPIFNPKPFSIRS
jgi:hypothetical protein